MRPDCCCGQLLLTGPGRSFTGQGHDYHYGRGRAVEGAVDVVGARAVVQGQSRLKAGAHGFTVFGSM